MSKNTTTPDKAKRDQWLARVKKSVKAHKPLPQWMVKAPKWVHADKEIMQHTVSQRAMALELASEEVKDDVEVVLAAVGAPTFNGEVFVQASRRIRDDRDVVLAAVKARGGALRYVSPRLQDDHQVAMAALKQNTNWTINYVSQRLKEDQVFMLDFLQTVGYMAMRQSGGKFCDDLADNKGFMSKAVVCDPFALSGASTRLKDDEDVALAAINRSGDLLCWASDRLKDQKELALKAIQNNPSGSYYWPASRLSSDYDIVLTATMNNPQTLSCSGLGWARDNKMMVMTALANPEIIVAQAHDSNSLHCEALGSISERLRNDEETMLAVFTAFHGYFQKHKRCGSIGLGTRQHISPRLLESKEFMLKAVQLCGMEAAYLAQDERISRDPQIIAAAKAHKEAAEQGDEALQERPRKRMKKATTSLFKLSYAKRGNKDIVLAAVQENGLDLQYAADDLRNHNREIVTAAIQQNPLALPFAGRQFHADPDVVILAIESCPTDGNTGPLSRILKVLPPHLQGNRDISEAVKAKGWPYGIVRIGEGGCDDETLMLKGIMEKNDDCFAFASHRLRRDKKIILAAIRQSSQNIAYVSTLLLPTPFLTELASTAQFQQHLNRLPRHLLPKKCAAKGMGVCNDENLQIHGIIHHSALSLTALFHALSQKPEMISR